MGHFTLTRVYRLEIPHLLIFFNSFADALAWILIYDFSIPYLLHYLDDFFLIARSGLQQHHVCDTACVSVTRCTISPKQSHRPCKVYNMV